MAGLEVIKRLTCRLSFCLRDLGISKEQLENNMEQLALQAFENISASPRPITMEQCKELFRYAYEGKDIDF